MAVPRDSSLGHGVWVKHNRTAVNGCTHSDIKGDFHNLLMNSYTVPFFFSPFLGMKCEGGA